MEKEGKYSVHPRWNDTRGVSIIHHATEEERKKLTEKMVETIINNVEKFHADKNKQNIKDLKSCQKDYLQEEKDHSTENFSWDEKVQREIVKRIYGNWA